MGNLKAFLSSSTLHIRQTYSRNMFRFMMFVQPLVFGTIMYLMFRNSNVDNIIGHIIYGTGLITIWGTIVYSSASDIARERWMGTLSIISCSPVKFIVIISGKIFGNVLLGLFSMVYSTLFLILVFNVKFHVENVLCFIITMLITILSFIAISMLLATLLTLSRQANVFMNALDYPIYILCGLVFPIDILPKYIKVFSYLLTPTWAKELLSISTSGITNYHDFYIKLGILSLLTSVYLIISIFFFKLIDRKTRKEATLEVV
ncbi:ABC transporter permease [Mycoplasmatota bacterium]|nr:ABC transporter permease [Mycoplasmatota bacterium]